MLKKHIIAFLLLCSFSQLAHLEAYLNRLPPSNTPYQYYPSPQPYPYGQPSQPLPSYAPPNINYQATVEDDNIAARVRFAIYNDPSLLPSSRYVQVTVNNRKVTLRGVVDSEAEKSKVEFTARQVRGVRSVDNKLYYKGAFY